MSNKKETAAGAAPKPKPKAAAKGPVMYVGPTIPGNPGQRTGGVQERT